jgi:hypothetical protein
MSEKLKRRLKTFEMKAANPEVKIAGTVNLVANVKAYQLEVERLRQLSDPEFAKFLEEAQTKSYPQFSPYLAALQTAIQTRKEAQEKQGEARNG